MTLHGENDFTSASAIVKMFSELTLKAFRIFFTNFAPWNTPFQWNDDTQELEHTRNKFRLLRWRASSLFQLFYMLFMYFRLYQSHIRNEVSINELVLQVPYLCMFIVANSSELTTFHFSKEIVFFFNQMVKTNCVFGRHTVLKKWDASSIVLTISIFAISTFSYICASYFAFHSHGTNFLYSIMDTSNQPKIIQLIVFGIFVVIEIVSLQCICNTFGTLFIIPSSYYVHSSYWLASVADSSHHSLTNGLAMFQIFTLLTRRFNEIFSQYFLASIKEVMGIAVTFTAFAIIRYHTTLGFPAILMLCFTLTADIIVVLSIYFASGLVWKYSRKAKRSLNTNHKIDKRVRKSLPTFGIMLGSFYIMKNYTVISFFDILVRYICTLLVFYKQ